MEVGVRPVVGRACEGEDIGDEGASWSGEGAVRRCDEGGGVWETILTQSGYSRSTSNPTF